MKTNMVAALTFLFGLLGVLSAPVAAEDKPPITVTNYTRGETVRYPLALLRGTLEDASAESVTVVNESSKLDSREMAGPANKGRFKALAELVPGENKLVVQAGNNRIPFTLTYTPQTNPYKIRAVLFADKTGDPTYDTPFKDDPQDYKAKWDAALKLLQTFTADEMHRQGYGRKTFNLELDANGKVVVHIAKGKGSFQEMQKLSGYDAYDASAAAIAEQLPRGPFKSLVCVAFSRHVKGTGSATAYAALGGGDTALMGGACFYAWPTGVKNIYKTFMSDVPIDDKNFHADDVGRFAVWATAATTIGCGLHEVGHALTLPHTKNYPNGIMLRGADTLNRYLGFVDPPCRGRKDYTEFKDDQEPCWSDVCAASLAASRWLALDDRHYTEKNTIRFSLDAQAGDLVVRSDDGLAFVCVETPGASEKFDKRAGLTSLPKEIRMPLADIAKYYQTSTLGIRAEDGMGHYRDASLNDMLAHETNLTTGKPVTASQEGSTDNAAGAAVDGEMGTYWDANPYPQWLQVDLQKAVTIDEIHLYTYVGEGRYYQYTIELSTDAKTWSKAVDASKNEERAADRGYRHVIPATSARYIRVTMLKNSTNPGVHIRELRVFEPGKPRSMATYGQLKALFETKKGN
ncbi:MAG: discoidin domain-containing protein [Planctomycetota bacterium]|nr:discoidin domain-containing protein [Planctomycetota bacterium]